MSELDAEKTTFRGEEEYMQFSLYNLLSCIAKLLPRIFFKKFGGDFRIKSLPFVKLVKDF